MKEIKCPLCGEKLEQFNVLRDGTLVEVGCHKCKWSTHPNSPEEAWKEVEEFISKFPPIMRVQVGDKIIRNGGRAYRIKETDLKDMSLFVVNIDDERDGRWLNQDKVALWPWELEQEGGNEQ